MRLREGSIMDVKFKFSGEGIAHDVDRIPTAEEVEEEIHNLLLDYMGVHVSVSVPVNEIKVKHD
jgi:hypothetical protein